jgi:ABC-2 type transport system ATP-binding protein
MVEFALDGADGAVTVEHLRSLNGVLNVRQEAGRYVLSVSELHLSVPALLEHVARSGVGLSELRTHSATLEDVFVCMTGRHLRDE